MVTFKLVEQSDAKFVYHYYPNDLRDEGYGVITIYRQEGRLELTQIAPLDCFMRYSVEEQNKRREQANQMRIAEQMPALTEKEWPTATEERITTRFADFAIREIIMAYNSDELLEEGSSPCY